MTALNHVIIPQYNSLPNLPPLPNRHNRADRQPVSSPLPDLPPLPPLPCPPQYNSLPNRPTPQQYYSILDPLPPLPPLLPPLPNRHNLATNPEIINHQIVGVKDQIPHVAALSDILFTTFRCTVCLDLIKTPVMFTRCCNNILGCQYCIMRLYEGDDGRSVLFADLIVVLVKRVILDELLKQIRPLVIDTHESDDDWVNRHW